MTGQEDLWKKGISGPFVELSARSGSGKEQLEEILVKMYENGEVALNDEVFLTNERQKQSFRKAKESLKLVISAIEEGLTEDFFAIDLMDAYASLGEVIGEAVEEDLVDRIFSKFCMGK